MFSVVISVKNEAKNIARCMEPRPSHSPHSHRRAQNRAHLLIRRLTNLDNYLDTPRCSAVVRDVPDEKIVGGNPSRLIRERRIKF
jgi:hypothetical protein